MGPEQPAYAVGGEFVGRCLLASASSGSSSSRATPEFSCTASHADTRRICPCLLANQTRVILK